MKRCNRDQDVAVRVIENSKRVDGFEADIRKLSKVLENPKASVQERMYAKHRIELDDEYRNGVKKNLKLWR